MPDYDPARIQHAAEQFGAGISHALSPILYSYYRSLREEGFDADSAMLLVCDVQHVILAASLDMGEDRAVG